MAKSNKPIERLQQAIGYTFQDITLLMTALTHRSFGQPHNERLEFLGDGLLNCLIAILLFQQLPKANEGELTRLRARLVCKETLAEIAQGIQLSDGLQLGQGELKSAGFRQGSILADALEALIAAIYLDSDWQAVQVVVSRLFQSELAVAISEGIVKDPKTRLQEWLQARQMSLPIYEVVQISGPPHDQQFTVSCRLAAFGEQLGTGGAKRIAEQVAAEKMLEKIRTNEK